MKEKGFTLIELLAVIVILSIIALIAIPIVLNIIEDANKSAAELSMKNIERSAEIYYNNKELTDAFEGIQFTCKNGKCTNGTESLDVKKNLPEKGTINIDKNGKVTFDSIILNGYLCVKENKFVCSKVNKLTETSEEGIITLKEANPNVYINYKIYGNSVQNETIDNPQEIKAVGNLVTDINSPNYGKYEIPIKVVGKNLWTTDESIYPIGKDNNLINYDKDTQVYSISEGTYARMQTIYKYSRVVIPENKKVSLTIVAIQGNLTGSAIVGGYNRSNNKTSWEVYETFPQNKTFNNTVITKTDLIQRGCGEFLLFLNQPVIVNEELKFKIQYEISDVPTEYEPHKENNYSIYLDEPLRCVDDVCDYIDFENGKVVRRVKEKDDSVNSIKVLYQLKASEVEEIELPNIKLNQGVSNIIIDTEIKPSKIELEYYER